MIVITIPRQLLAIVSTSVYRTLAQERLDILPAIPDQAANPEEPWPSLLPSRSPEPRDLQRELRSHVTFAEVVSRTLTIKHALTVLGQQRPEQKSERPKFGR